MKYWHEISENEQKSLFGRKTWDYVLKNYKQPKWCDYPDALLCIAGCWSLLNSNIRKKISKEYCKDCDYFVLKEKKR